MNFIRHMVRIPGAWLLWFFTYFTLLWPCACRPLMKPLQSWIHWMKTRTKTAHLSCSCLETTSQWVTKKVILTYRQPKIIFSETFSEDCALVILQSFMLVIKNIIVQYSKTTFCKKIFYLFISYGPLTMLQMRAKEEMEERTKHPHLSTNERKWILENFLHFFIPYCFTYDYSSHVNPWSLPISCECGNSNQSRLFFFSVFHHLACGCNESKY